MLRRVLLYTFVAQCFILSVHGGSIHDHPNPVRRFEVSEVGADKSELLQVFELVRCLEGKKGKPLSSFEILQRINGKEFMVYKKTRVFYEYKRDDGRIGRRSKMETDRSTRYWLIFNDSKKYVDGDMIVNTHYIETDEIKSYEAVSGAALSVRVLREPPKKMIPKSEFVERLKRGEVWVLESYDSQQCVLCLGNGRRNDSELDYGKCFRCDGRGVQFINLRVMW